MHTNLLGVQIRQGDLINHFGFASFMWKFKKISLKNKGITNLDLPTTLTHLTLVLLWSRNVASSFHWVDDYPSSWAFQWVTRWTAPSQPESGVKVFSKQAHWVLNHLKSLKGSRQPTYTPAFWSRKENSSGSHYCWHSPVYYYSLEPKITTSPSYWNVVYTMSHAQQHH